MFQCSLPLVWRLGGSVWLTPLSNGDPPIRVHHQQKLMVNGGGCSGGFCVLLCGLQPNYPACLCAWRGFKSYIVHDVTSAWPYSSPRCSLPSWDAVKPSFFFPSRVFFWSCQSTFCYKRSLKDVFGSYFCSLNLKFFQFWYSCIHKTCGSDRSTAT